MINDFTTFCTTPRTRRQYGSCNWILVKNYRANIYNYLFVGSFHILTQTIFFLIYTCPKWKQWEKSGIYITRQFMAIQNSGLDNNQVKWIHRRLETFKVIVSTFFLKKKMTRKIRSYYSLDAYSVKTLFLCNN